MRLYDFAVILLGGEFKWLREPCIHYYAIAILDMKSLQISAFSTRFVFPAVFGSLHDSGHDDELLASDSDLSYWIEVSGL